MSYNIHPLAGNGQEIKKILGHIGLSQKESQDVIDDVKDFNDIENRSAIKEIVDKINYAYGRNIVHYKPSNHWNKGTCRFS